MATPEGKYLFGSVTVGEKGQIVIPKQARDVFNIKAGDKLIVLGDINQGLAILPSDKLLDFTSDLLKLIALTTETEEKK